MLLNEKTRDEIFKYQDIMSASHEIEIQTAEEMTKHMGCTCDLVLITKTEIICGNVGDSRCVLALRKGEGDNETIEHFDMSTDHKPDLPSETERVIKAGGTVTANRVDGGLNLGRSLGDLYYKLDKKLP